MRASNAARHIHTRKGAGILHVKVYNNLVHLRVLRKSEDLTNMDLLHHLEHLLNEHMLDVYIYTHAHAHLFYVYIYIGYIYIYTHK